MTKGVVSGGVDLRRARHKHFVVVLCQQRTPRCARRSLPWLWFSQFATRTVDNTVDLYAAKPDIRPESRFCLPHCIRRPRQGVPVGISPSRLAWKN